MFTTFWPKAVAKAGVIWWGKPSARPRRRIVIFGGLGFWAVVGTFWLIIKIIETALWLVIVAAITVAQLAVWLVQLIAWPLSLLSEVRPTGKRADPGRYRL